MNIPIQTHQVRPRYRPRGISAICSLPHDVFDPMWDSIIVAKENMERLPSQTIMNLTSHAKASLSVCVPQRLQHLGWAPSVCTLQEVLNG